MEHSDPDAPSAETSILPSPHKVALKRERPIEADADHAVQRADGGARTMYAESTNFHGLQASLLHDKQKEATINGTETKSKILDSIASPKEDICSESFALNSSIGTTEHLHTRRICNNSNIRLHQQEMADARYDQIRRPGGLGLDLNEIDDSIAAEHNPFYPYKKLGQTRVSEPSECGSTSCSAEGKDSLKRWEEMKQNGFLTSWHGAVPTPKRGCRPKRKMSEEFGKSFVAQKEANAFKPVSLQKSITVQANKSVKMAAPGGLLSGLNPGIINHVRNSKQVFSIIQAMVQLEEPDHQGNEVVASRNGQPYKESTERKHEHDVHSSKSGFLSLGIPQHAPKVDNMSTHKHNMKDTNTSSKFSSDINDNLKLQLSLSGTSISEKTAISFGGDLTMNHEYMASLSHKAAYVASQWLDLLHQDIRGRLAALKRSKRRVRNAIQTELPYIVSTELSSSQENDSLVINPAGISCPEKSIPAAHVSRWSLFLSQMDKALIEEGRQLESLLRQVQEMQMSCENGLAYAAAASGSGSQMGSAAELSNLSQEASERECAIKAAAASIYSTCNLVVRPDNPTRF